jgi:hypothetical protein
VNFEQDLAAMESLIKMYTSQQTGSVEDVFAAQLSLESRWFPKGWEDLDMDNDDSKANVPQLQHHGARLLLLLAYIMTSNVSDDKSNEMQM